MNIHTLSDEKPCGGVTTYGVTLFQVGSRSVAEERFGLFTKGRKTFICVALLGVQWVVCCRAKTCIPAEMRINNENM